MGRVEEFFQPNPSWWVKKIQPNSSQGFNPIHVDWAGPMGWKFFLISIIIIKLGIRITPLQIKANL